MKNVINKQVEDFRDAYIVHLDNRLSSESSGKIVQMLQEGGLINEQVRSQNALCFGFPVLTSWIETF